MRPRVSTVRLEDSKEVRDELWQYNPSVVINAAGKAGGPLGENIDWCEENKQRTWESNVIGPMVLKNECDKYQIPMVHLASGCIYDSGENITEEDEPTPNSFYGESKAFCDRALLESPGIPPLIIRLRMPIHHVSNPRNIIDKVLRYEYVLDHDNSMTYVPTLMHAIHYLVERNKHGIFNIVNKGVYSPYDIIKEYLKWHPEQVRPNIIPVNMDKLIELNKVSTGRSNCTLSTEKLESLGYHLPEIDLEEVIKKHGTSLGVVSDLGITRTSWEESYDD